MNTYSILVFLHILGALGIFIGLGMEWASLRRLQRATHGDQVRVWLPVVAGVRRIGMPSMILVLVSGFLMMRMAWTHLPWITVAVASAIVMILLLRILTTPRLRAIARLMTNDAMLSPELERALQDPLLAISMQVRAALALGIVFLMTIKPALPTALLAIVIATAAGLVSMIPRRRRDNARVLPANGANNIY